MPQEPFGQVLRKAREARSLSQRTLAQRAGVTDSYISQLESGRRRPPRPRVIAALAKALGLPPESLQEAADLERVPHRLRRRLRSADRERGRSRSLRDRLLGTTLYYFARGPHAVDPSGAFQDLPEEHRLLLGRVLARARRLSDAQAVQDAPEQVLDETTAAEREVIAQVLPEALAGPSPHESTSPGEGLLPLRLEPHPQAEITGRLTIDPALAAPNAFFWRMRGDQAHPRVEDGDLLLLVPDLTPAAGELIVVRVDGRTEVRLWHVRGSEARLDAVRPDQPPLRVPIHDLAPCVVRALLRWMPPAVPAG